MQPPPPPPPITLQKKTKQMKCVVYFLHVYFKEDISK